MANITIPREELEKGIGRITKEIEDKISLFGTPLEKVTENEIELEIFPNRPDMLSTQGFLRGFKAFLGKSHGMVKYKLNKPEKDYHVKVSSSVKSIRPYTVCAIVKNLKLDDVKISEIIELQEKLHSTIGRNRKKVAIGIYPLEKIKLPITYTALPPKDIKFIPLEEDKELNAIQILKKHPAGKEYAHLLEEHDKFPIFIDADKKILSMPPIINSNDTGKITERTKEVFIECSGHHLPTLEKTLNIIVTTLADMGGKVFQMEIQYDKDIITPNLASEKIKLSLENVNKLLGLELKESDLSKLLPRMGMEYKNKFVSVPAWRSDILHEVDVIEDIAIAYGYDNLQPRVPNIFSISEETSESKTTRIIREILIGLGLAEISTYHLIKDKESFLAKSERIDVLDSKTEYKILRDSLLPSALRILSENKDKEYPQEVFEIGTVFENGATETGIREKTNLLIISSPANFTKMKQILNSLTLPLGIKHWIEESTHPQLIDGRTASITLGEEIGYMGEIHPETLKAWSIKMPAAVIEICLDEIFESFSKG